MILDRITDVSDGRMRTTEMAWLFDAVTRNAQKTLLSAGN